MGTAILDQQQAFAEAYVLGNSPVSARQTASRLLHTPHVQEAIRRARAHALRGRLASKALGGALEKILDDDGAPAGVRVDAAKTVLDRAGFAAARMPEPDAMVEKSLHEMTGAELEDFVRRGYRQLEVLSLKSRAAIDADTA